MWTEERIAKAARLWADGLSITAIGKALDTNRSSVAGIMNRRRARFPRRGQPENLCKGGRRAKPTKTRAEQRERQRANAARAAERKAKALAAKAAEAPRPAPAPKLPATLPVSFADAVERGRCLHFIGDPFGPDGPAMPVCGGQRAAEPVRGRYCPYHQRSQFRATDARAGNREARL